MIMNDVLSNSETDRRPLVVEDATANWDVFLAAGLRQPGCLSRNRDVIRTIRSAGLSVFAPQEQLPLDSPVTPSEIVERNRTGVIKSTLLLLIPEGAGAGVYYEVGLAEALGKSIIAFGLPPSAEQGAVPLGQWLSLSKDHRIDSLTQLRDLLLHLFAKESEYANAQT